MRLLSVVLALVLSVPAYAEVTDSRAITRTAAAAESVTSEEIRIELVQPAGRAATAETERDRERRRSKLLRRLEKFGFLKSREVVIHADGSMTVTVNAGDLEQIRAEISVVRVMRVETSPINSSPRQDSVDDE